MTPDFLESIEVFIGIYIVLMILGDFTKKITLVQLCQSMVLYGLLAFLFG